LLIGEAKFFLKMSGRISGKPWIRALTPLRNPASPVVWPGDKSILESVEKGEDEVRDAYREANRVLCRPTRADIVSRQA
jgi:hypothetical protein